MVSSSGGGDPGGPPHAPTREPWQIPTLPDDIGDLAALLRAVASKLAELAEKSKP